MEINKTAKITVSSYFQRTVKTERGKYSFKDIYQKSANYYKLLRSDPRKYAELKSRIFDIGKIVMEKIPVVSEVYGVGYPFYGNVQPLRRLADIKNKRDEQSAESLAMRSIPDIDLLIIFSSNRGPYKFSEEIVDECRDIFHRRAFSFGNTKNDLLNAIPEGYYHSGVAKKESDLLYEFMEKDNIHIDLLPIPEHIWKELPFFAGYDIWIPKLTRDIGFTCEPIGHKWRRSNVVDNFRINYLLRMLDKFGHLRTNDLIEKTINSHQYGYIAKMYPEAEENVRNLWFNSLGKLYEQDLAVSGRNEHLFITEKGKEILKQMAARRDKILIEGFDIP